MTTLAESKRNLITRYQAQLGYKTFIETGTMAGDMIAAVLPAFDRLLSVELKDDLYESSRDRFKDHVNVVIHHNDSPVFLKQIVPLLMEPAIFFLDAHYSGGYTGRGPKETPVLDELEVILSGPQLPHVILIDDLADFGSNPEYPTIGGVKSLVDKFPGAGLRVILEAGGMMEVRMAIPEKEKVKND